MENALAKFELIKNCKKSIIEFKWNYLLQNVEAFSDYLTVSQFKTSPNIQSDVKEKLCRVRSYFSSEISLKKIGNIS